MRCPNRPVRQDRLDAVVWRELMRLLEDPALLEAELERRLEAGRETDPQRRRRAGAAGTSRCQTGDCVPGRIDRAGRVAQPDAGHAQPEAGSGG